MKGKFQEVTIPYGLDNRLVTGLGYPFLAIPFLSLKHIYQLDVRMRGQIFLKRFETVRCHHIWAVVRKRNRAGRRLFTSQFNPRHKLRRILEWVI